MRSAVVLQWSRLGDVLQTRPLLRSLRQAGHKRVILSADVSFAGVVRCMPEEPEFWPLDLAQISGAARHSTSHADFIRLLDNVFRDGRRMERSDVYVLTRSAAAALFAEMLKPETVHGYRLQGADLIAPEQIRWMDSAIGDHCGTPVHLADLWTSLSPLEMRGQWLPPLKADGIAPVCHANDRRTVGILCDAGESYRSIPPEWLISWADCLIRNLELRVVLLGKAHSSEGDALTAWAVKRPDRVLDRRGQTSLDQLCHALTNVNLVIGPDTGGLHLAAAVGTPVIGLFFGGAVCLHTGPYHERAIVIQDPEWSDLYADRIAVLAGSILANEQLPVNGNEMPVFVPGLDEYGLLYKLQGTDSLPSSLISERTKFFQHFRPKIVQENGAAFAMSVIIPEKGESHYTDAILSDLKTCTTDLKIEIIVVSSGRSVERTEISAGSSSIKSVWRRESLTFAEACNLGAREAHGKWLLFLNNDCRVDSTFLNSLLARAEDDSFIAPLIRYPDGTIQNAGVAFDAGGIHEIAHGEHNAPGSKYPQALSAVALMMSFDAFRGLNGFDESYRNGYEDLDLCLRAHEAGYKLHVADDIEVTHFRGSTEGRFEHDDANRKLFVERWWRVFNTPEHKLSTRPEPEPECPVVIVSDEPAVAAGSCLRWIWPLSNRGLCQNKDFAWLQSGAEPLDKCAVRTLSAARSIVVFRPLRSASNVRIIEETVARTGAKLVVDADDLFLGRFRSQSMRGMQRTDFEEGYQRLLHIADAITIATPYLRERLREFNFEAAVLKTMPCRQMMQPSPGRQTHAERRIGFFGTPAHHVDLGGIVPAIGQILDQYDDVYFYWWGCRPGQLVHHPRVRQGGPLIEDYLSHLRRLTRFGLDVALTPLLESPASQARSPIKYYEYALAGIPSIYSRVTPYSDIVVHGQTGMLAGESTPEWIAMMDALLSDAALRIRIRHQAQADVLAQMTDMNLIEEMDPIMDRLFPDVLHNMPDRTKSVPCPM
ncbi:glycosyltransferase [candidate division KSB1 bacterium]|nr:MAG: glycosyltransferase [candidate division KSB1 bacterium]